MKTREQLIADGVLKPAPGKMPVIACKSAIYERQHRDRLYTATDRAMAILRAAVQRQGAKA